MLQLHYLWIMASLFVSYCFTVPCVIDVLYHCCINCVLLVSSLHRHALPFPRVVSLWVLMVDHHMVCYNGVSLFLYCVCLACVCYSCMLFLCLVPRCVCVCVYCACVSCVLLFSCAYFSYVLQLWWYQLACRYGYLVSLSGLCILFIVFVYCYLWFSCMCVFVLIVFVVSPRCSCRSLSVLI